MTTLNSVWQNSFFIFLCLNIYFPCSGKTVFNSLMHFVCNLFAVCSGRRSAAVRTSVNGGAEWSADVAYRKFFVPSNSATLLIAFLFMSEIQ